MRQVIGEVPRKKQVFQNPLTPYKKLYEVFSGSLATGKYALWSIWQQALQHLEIYGHQATPLGNWIAPPHLMWHWYMGPISLILYKEVHHYWFQCKPLIRPSNRTTRSQTTALYQITDVSLSTEPPHSALSVTVINNPITALAAGTYSSSAFQIQQNHEPKNSNLYQLLTLIPFYTRLLGPIPTARRDKEETNHHHITQGDLYLCTDGSFDPITCKAAHGWVIANRNTTL